MGKVQRHTMADSENLNLITLLKSTPDIFINIDLNQSIKYINIKPGWIKNESFTGNGILDLYPNEDRDRIDQIHKKCIKTGKQGEYEFRNHETDQWFSVSALPVVQKAKIIGLNLVMRDVTNYRKLIETLQDEKKLTADLIETAQIIILILDTKGRIVSFNPYMEEISGYKIEEVKGKNWFDIFIPEKIIPDIRKIFSKAITGKKTHGNINSIISKSGKIREIEWFDKILVNSKGETTGLLSIGQDITGRLKVEASLKEREAMLSDAIKLARLGYWEFDIKNNVLILNDQFLSLFHTDSKKTGGYKVSIERALELFVYPDDRKNLNNKINNIITSDKKFPEHEIMHRFSYDDEGIGYMSVRIIKVEDDKGNVIKITGTSQDITQSVKAEEALHISEDHLSNAASIAKLGYWEYDVASNLFTFNDHFYSIFRTTAEAMGGYRMTPEHYAETFIPEEERSLVEKETRLAISAADPDYFKQLEHRIYYADGEIGYISVRIFIKQDEDGKTIKTYGANQDITERKKSELKLKVSLEKLKKMNIELEAAKLKAEESDKLKSAFLANMSHEIRTPMNGIIGFSKMLNRSNLSEERRHQYTDIISDLCKQLLHLIDDIIDISKIETGQIKIHNVPVNMNDIILSLYSVYNPITSKNGVNLYIQKTLPDEKATFYTDSVKLRQILDNLLSNAVKFTHGGYIKFGYRDTDEFLEFFVEDSGIGIDIKYQNSIFERFIQISEDSSRLYSGTGLGLSISKAYVEKMGGKIWVNSEPGKGSTFFFTLPYENSKSKTTEFSKNKIKSVNGHKHVILVVEDDEINFLFLEELLIDLNVDILHAKNGKESIELCSSNQKINLVLMDIKLPDIEGYVAVKRIREVQPNLPIIAQTAYAMAGDREKAINAGCNDYISKPVDETELFEKIRFYLEI